MFLILALSEMGECEIKCLLSEDFTLRSHQRQKDLLDCCFPRS